MKIWAYWEGPKPLWIQRCQETIENHSHGELEVLNADSFQSLWVNDRDLDLDKLCLAHKADFIRIYMLKHYGGLWLDLDCVVMSDLRPMLKTTKHWDFIAYKHWTGAISNAFIGCKPESLTASHYYARAVRILRKGNKFDWTELGEGCIHDAYAKVKAPRLRLAVDFVSPVCWSDNGKFFGSDIHFFNPNSLAYMLCHHLIAKDGNGDKLLDENTFFSFLLKKSNENRISTP